MECGHVRLMLPDYLLQMELDAEVVSEIMNHLQKCNSCKLEMDETRRLLEAFDGPVDLFVCRLFQQSIDDNTGNIYIEVNDQTTIIKMTSSDNCNESDDPLEPEIGRLLMARLRHMADVPLLQDTGDGRIHIHYKDENLVFIAKFNNTEDRQLAFLNLEMPGQQFNQ